MARLSVAQGPCSAVPPNVHGCHYAFQKFPFFCVTLYQRSFVKTQNTVIPRLTKIIRSGVTFVSRNVFISAPGMARSFVFAALCQRAHPLKHSLAESEKQRKNLRQPKNSLAGSLVSRGITVQFCGVVTELHYITACTRIILQSSSTKHYKQQCTQAAATQLTALFHVRVCAHISKMTSPLKLISPTNVMRENTQICLFKFVSYRPKQLVFRSLNTKDKGTWAHVSLQCLDSRKQLYMHTDAYYDIRHSTGSTVFNMLFLCYITQYSLRTTMTIHRHNVCRRVR